MCKCIGGNSSLGDPVIANGGASSYTYIVTIAGEPTRLIQTAVVASAGTHEGRMIDAASLRMARTILDRVRAAGT